MVASDNEVLASSVGIEFSNDLEEGQSPSLTTISNSAESVVALVNEISSSGAQGITTVDEQNTSNECHTSYEDGVIDKDNGIASTDLERDLS